MHQLALDHWLAVKSILRYLHGTITHGLAFSFSSSISLHTYSDANWVSSTDDRCSTIEFCIFLGPNLISWSTKKQPTVSRSSTEVEYRSFSNTCVELLCPRFLLQELHILLASTPILWCDNIGATFLASNPMFHARTKHVKSDYHFICESIASKELSVHFLCSNDQLANLLTKQLPTPRFQFIKSKLKVLFAPPA